MNKHHSHRELIGTISQLLRNQSTATIFLHQAIAERLGINPTDHKCMELLLKYGSMTAGELAVKSNLTTGAITGVIDRLEKANYVRRVKDPNDRRRFIIEIVPDCLPAFEQLFQSIGEETASLLNSYSDHELMVIRDFIEKSTEVALNVTSKLRQG
ncbi:MarR family transcriptional regulator [Bacillus litorisediminis]|uniref:MarR family transcriptional regulator n=1 Tax=Bacillus litorisediminis TaxID=2922713 RepID=UPI001FAD8E1D|nr:MarR family transcriptional regulator [Bacillus litorisediminis]